MSLLKHRKESKFKLIKEADVIFEGTWSKPEFLIRVSEKGRVNILWQTVRGCSDVAASPVMLWNNDDSF
jgi:hypothetical protein